MRTEKEKLSLQIATSSRAIKLSSTLLPTQFGVARNFQLSRDILEKFRSRCRGARSTFDHEERGFANIRFLTGFPFFTDGPLTKGKGERKTLQKSPARSGIGMRGR